MSPDWICILENFSTMIANLQKGRFRSLCTIIENDKFITTDGYLDFSHKAPSFTYHKRDFIFKNGIWRGKKVKSLLSLGNGDNSKLILGHSDLKTNLLDLFMLRTLGYKKVAGINTLTIKDFSISLPLGITNNNIKDSKMHIILGDPNHFMLANENSYFVNNYEYKFYVNFNHTTNIKVRSDVIKVLKDIDKKSLVKVDVDYSSEGRIRYLISLRSIPMVLCPEGNGPDTHRFWETLYMGGMPVVIENKFLNNFFDHLPVIRLSRWSDLLLKDLIKKKYFQAENKVWNRSILDKNFWFDQLLKF